MMAKPKPVKPYNDGQWTTARMRSFAMSALRRAQWPAKYKSINSAFLEDGVNPATGKKCKIHQCPECEGKFKKGDMHADHIEPVVPVDGVWGETTRWLGYNWNELMPRLWAELEGYQPLCKPCHKAKSKEEAAERALAKKARS